MINQEISYDLIDLEIKLQKKQPKSIVLQFPNNQLKQAIKVKRQLQLILPLSKFYILSDHLKPDCCVDIVGAKHIFYDLIIHFGLACFTEVNEKIEYVFPRVNVGVENFVQTFQNLDLIDWLIMADQVYSYLIDFIDNEKKNFRAVPKIYENQSDVQELVDFAAGYNVEKRFIQSSQNKKLLFIGDSESSLLQKVLMQVGLGYFQTIKVLNTHTLQMEDFSFNINPILMRRSKYILKARECNCFGFLVSNPSAKFVSEVLYKCEQLVKGHKKKFFTFSMNNITEPKLGNFPEIDSYVIISCQNNAIIDEKQYYKLIITPFDLICALDDDWNFNYDVKMDLTNFKLQNFELPEEIIEDKEKIQENSQLVKINLELQEVSQMFQTLDFFSNRNFQGLKQNPEQPAIMAKLGLSGIASNYQQH